MIDVATGALLFVVEITPSRVGSLAFKVWEKVWCCGSLLDVGVLTNGSLLIAPPLVC